LDDVGIEENDSEVVKLIKQILSSRIKPFVQDDGGDVKFVAFD
jgi:Fe-S cluster biogenesis protein NfuA